MKIFKFRRYWALILIGVISFLALFIILIDVISPSKELSLRDFARNMITSAPFAILIAVVDYQLVRFVNCSKWLQQRVFVRIVVESLALVVLAIVFVLCGNVLLFWVEGTPMLGYLSSTSFYVSATAATLINIFTVTFIEFFVQLKQNESLQKDNLQMQYKQLKSQINPHFLFNSLNVLTSLIHKDSQQAVQYTQKLSQIYRYVLSQDDKELVYVADELEFIETYVQVLRMRYGSALCCHIDIGDDALGLSIPPMSLQLLIENAVKHNAVSAKCPLTIIIKDQAENLVVSNNIIPRISVEDSTEIGLKNLELKYNIISKQSIVIENNNNQFTVKLPLL